MKKSGDLKRNTQNKCIAFGKWLFDKLYTSLQSRLLAQIETTYN